MADDDPLIEALTRAVDLAPTDVELRRQLVRLLIERDLHELARQHCMAGLWNAPGDHDLLTMGLTIAAALDDHDAAAGFRRVLTALAGSPEPIEGAPRPDAWKSTSEPSSAPRPTEQDIDDFVADVFDEHERTRVRLDDVAGLDHVKRRLRQSFLAPLNDRDLGERYGVSARGGLLLYGPPGCGKTQIARALAGELGLRFISVELHEVLDMWFGASERNLHDLFDSARAHTPALLFFDELDAVGHRRSRLQGSAGRNVVTRLLEELDPVEPLNEGLFVLGATNAPWDVDPALRRPGRFDSTLFVAPPDHPARVQLFDLFLRDRPLAVGIDTNDLATRARGFSGADIELACNIAAQEALSDTIREDREVRISQPHLLDAVLATSPSTGAWFQGARNVVTFADRAQEYVELSAHMRSEGLL